MEIQDDHWKKVGIWLGPKNILVTCNQSKANERMSTKAPNT